MLESIQTSYGIYKVVKATRDDVSEVSGLLQEVATWLRGKNIDQWSYLADRSHDDSIRENIELEQVYLVKDKDEIIATFALNKQQGKWDADLWGQLEDHSIYLHRLAVARARKGEGLGREILSWIEKKARVENIDYIKLDCVEYNHPLNQFYLANGYEHQGTKNSFSLYQKRI